MSSSHIRAYPCLEILVLTLRREGYVFNHVRCTGLKCFREGEKRNDWAWIRRHPRVDGVQPGLLNVCIPCQFNKLFKLNKMGIIYRLAHMSPLVSMNSTAIQSIEAILHVGWLYKKEGQVVRIAHMEGIPHLILLEPEESWLIHNRIYLESWNTIYD